MIKEKTKEVTIHGKNLKEKLETLKQLLFMSHSEEDKELVVDSVSEIIYQFEYESFAEQFVQSKEMQEIKDTFDISVTVDKYGTETHFVVKMDSGYNQRVIFDLC